MPAVSGPISPFFSPGGGFGITGSRSAGWTFTKTAQASTAETVVTFGVSDDAVANLAILNADTTNSLFIPLLRGTGSGNNNSLFLMGSATTDTGTQPVVKFDARTVAGAAIATRPLYSFRNLNVAVADVSALGAWTYTVLRTDSTAESLATWKLDEDTSSNASVANFTSSNAAFIPMFRGIAASTNTAAVFAGRAGTDTGTNPVTRIDARIGTGTAVATRPAIAFSNAGVDMAQFTAAGNLALVNGMSLGLRMELKSYTVATLPAAGAAGGVIFVSDAGGNGPCIAVSNGTNWKRCDNVSTTVV